MKKLLAIIVQAFILIVPAGLNAEEGFYIGAQGGVNFLYSKYLHSNNCSFDTGYNVGGVGGYAWCKGYRLESEVTYHHNDYTLHGINTAGDPENFYGNIHTWSFMANGYYVLPFFRSIKPYIGAGIGCDNVHQEVNITGEKFKGSNTGFAWQLMAGLDYSICKDIVVDTEYKYHAAPLQHGHTLQNHSITIGVKKFFGCCY